MLAVPASAQVEGCDPAVMNALQASAEARLAYDTAVTEQITNKPDSVLALTCFNQAAGVSAKKGGAIFSGDFTADLAKIVTPALADHYKNFENAPGYDSGLVKYNAAATTLTDTFDCPAMKDLWKKTTEDPVSNNCPAPDFDALAQGTFPPGIGEDCKDSLEASLASFQKRKAAEDALPKAEEIDYTGADSLCAVMQKTGINTGNCP